jgi:O-methyltransferase
VTRDARRLAAGWKWRLGFVLGTPVPAEYDDEIRATIKRVRRSTMTTAPRIASLCDSVEHAVRTDVEGAFVECGVWRGGSIMAIALTLLRLGATDRDLYLFDTFEGMPAPGELDEDSPYDGYSIHRRWQRRRNGGIGSSWNRVSAESVRARVEGTGYPPERIHVVPGLVEETVPEHAPDRIALLRMDTDWYEPTRHQLEHLYPRLSIGGVLIVDDYGHYVGARKAVEEYFAENGPRPLLNRIDYTGRIAVKSA